MRVIYIFKTLLQLQRMATTVRTVISFAKRYFTEISLISSAFEHVTRAFEMHETIFDFVRIKAQLQIDT